MHIYLGGPERRQEATAADIIIYGNKDMMFGLGAWSAGDVNNEGFDDILMTATVQILVLFMYFSET